MRKILLIGSIFLLAFAVYFLIRNNSTKPSPPDTQSNPTSSHQTPIISSNTLVAVGDIMLSRHVGEKIKAKGDPKSPFLYTAEILSKADITFGNLESPFDDKGTMITEGMVFKAEPDTIEGLKYAGFDILSLANNHLGNRGVSGMNFTFSHLKNNKIEYVGAGENDKQAAKTRIIEKNGIKFAFLAYNDMDATITPTSYKASSQKPGVNPLIEKSLKQDITKAKEVADIVIVSIHWGTEYQQTANDHQKNIGHLAIDSGASVVLGHHPHVLQPYEKYNEGYIFYSLGNFVFDQMWSEKTRKGEIARIYFKDKQIEKVETIPITIYDYFQPKPNTQVRALLRELF